MPPRRSDVPRSVIFRRYGGPEVLEIVDVPRPKARPGQFVVRVVAAALNPGEARIREGEFAAQWPARFPEGQGNDFAGTVVEVGDGATGFAVGDEVIGFAPRAAHADFVVVERDSLTAKPAELAWNQAACIAGVGSTAWAAVEAVDPQAGETVVVSAAAGGVGVLAAQLARLRGARVIGTSGAANFDRLRSLGVEPILYGPDLGRRLTTATAPSGIDAFVDNFGDGNVEVALGVGIAPDRINTIADGDVAALHPIHTDAQAQASSPTVWSRLAILIVAEKLTIPIAAEYPLEEVARAYRDVASRHGFGKRVLKVAVDE
jgi:NADPH:quinone reductase-like Zn-dependent oxidoreductase